MDYPISRELEAYCQDFATVRSVLRHHHAVFIEVKNQVDSYYHPPAGNAVEGASRLKRRVEGGQRTLIYYRHQPEGEARTSRFRLAQADDAQVGEMLEAALGSRLSSANSANSGARITSYSIWTRWQGRAKSSRRKSRTRTAATSTLS